VVTAKNELQMKYLIRALKYFVWFCVILTITLYVMAALGVVEPNIESMFRGGTKSLWQIAILFLVLAAIYPFSGFMRKDVIIPGEYSAIRDKVIKFMESRGYSLETEEGENMTFRLRSKVGAAFKMFEDRITFTRTSFGFEAEGLRKVVVRIASGLEYAFKEGTEDYSK